MAYQVLCVGTFIRSVPTPDLDDAKNWARQCSVSFEVVDLATGEVVWDDDQMAEEELLADSEVLHNYA